MNKQLLPAYLLTFVNVLGFSILMPILPFVVEDMGAEEWVYGLLLSVYSAFQFIGAPYLGSLSDMSGRKPILLVSQAGTLLSWLVFLLALYLPEQNVLGYALPLWIIALSRILDGVTGGNTSVANAYVADITSREQKSYIFGYLGGIAGLGMVIGPALGGLAAGTSIGYSGTILLAAGISTLTLITIWFWLKESHPPEKRAKKHRQKVFMSLFLIKRIREANPDAVIKTIFTIKFFFSIMMACYVGTIALFIIDLFEFNPQQLGIFMLAVGGFMAFNQAVLSKQFIKRFGEYRTLIIGLSLTVLGLFCITITENLWAYLGFYYVMNLGLALCFPTFNALISVHADPEHQGEIMGISESISSFAMAAFPILAAWIYGEIGFEFYYIVAALPLIGLFIALLAIRRLGKGIFDD